MGNSDGAMVTIWDVERHRWEQCRRQFVQTGSIHIASSVKISFSLLVEGGHLRSFAMIILLINTEFCDFCPPVRNVPYFH